MPPPRSAPCPSGLILVGVALHFADWSVTVRAVAIFLFLMLTAPIAAHMIGRAALRMGVPLYKGLKNPLGLTFQFLRILAGRGQERLHDGVREPPRDGDRGRTPLDDVEIEAGRREESACQLVGHDHLGHDRKAPVLACQNSRTMAHVVHLRSECGGVDAEARHQDCRTRCGSSFSVGRITGAPAASNPRKAVMGSPRGRAADRTRCFRDAVRDPSG